MEYHFKNLKCVFSNVLVCYPTNNFISRMKSKELPVFNSVVHQEAVFFMCTYRKVSNISRTKSQNSNSSRLGLQLPLRNILKPSVKWGMKMWLEQRRQAMLQLHLSDQQFNGLLKCVLYYRLDGIFIWFIFNTPWGVSRGLNINCIFVSFILKMVIL